MGQLLDAVHRDMVNQDDGSQAALDQVSARIVGAAVLMAGNPDRYAVDPDELDAVVGDLETCQQKLQTTTDHLEAQIAKLHATWEGLSAAAQREAHQEWEAGMAVMQACARGDAPGGPGRAHQLHARGRRKRLDVATGSA